MKWNATNIVTLFFYPHELTKIVLKSSSKYYCTKKHYLALRTEPKKFFLFFRVIYHTGQDQRVPTFIFFSALRDFFFRKNNFSPKGPPAIFWCFASEWMLKNPKGSSLSVFFGIVRFFHENKNFCFLQFFVLRQNGCWKTSKGPPFSFSALWDFSAPGARASEPRCATRSIFSFFWICNFFENFFLKNFRFSSTVIENTWHLEVFLLFLSLGHGADLGRSRLV